MQALDDHFGSSARLIRGGFGRLTTMESRAGVAESVVEALRADKAVLLRQMSLECADEVMKDIAQIFALNDCLEMRVSESEVHGHRSAVSRYFTTVNERSDYVFIGPHCEGGGMPDIQISAFYCRANSTDGGATVALNVDSGSPVWERLRRVKIKIKLSRVPLTAKEESWLSAAYGISSGNVLDEAEDEIVREYRCPLDGVKVLSTLSKPGSVRSKVLGRDVMPYWDEISLPDFDSRDQFVRLMKDLSLMREPKGGIDLSRMDHSAGIRVWRSGMTYGGLFKCAIARVLQPGELIVLNNLTWCHGASNWTPGSGKRDVVTSFI